MPDEKKEPDNINSLCKKYFTPELCDEPVLESKRTLKRKLQEQLYKYGVAVVSRKFLVKDADTKEQFCFDVVEDAMEKFFEKGNEKVISQNFAAYFSAILSDFGLRTKKKLHKEPMSLNTTVSSSEGEESTLLDCQKGDERLTVVNWESRVSALQDAKLKFLFIDKCYRVKKRSDFLKSMITQRLYTDLHKYFESIDYSAKSFFVDSMKRYSFIDIVVYNFKNVPSAKEVAAYLQKDEGQMSKAVNKFLDFVFEMYKKEGMKL